MPQYVDDSEYMYQCCVTPIHEASHKFALTSDVYCFNDVTGALDPSNKFIKTDANGKFAYHAPENAGMDMKLLGNADSYGHFACRRGYAEVNLMLTVTGVANTSNEGS